MAPLDDDEEDASDASAQADDEGSETGAPPSYLQHERAMLQRGLLASHQTGWSSSFDLEALCDRLHGLSVEEAEKDAREALREAKDEARDGDVLAILLQVFQSARSSVLDSEEDPTDYTWTEVLGYCSRLCALCDRNFLSLAGQPGPDDFPLRVVASVYAECGRTLSVASRPAEARNRLEKALNVFRLISEPTEEEAWLLAGCRASLARASRQLGQLKSAQDEFLQALQLMADLPEPRTGFGCLSASVCLCLCVEESSRGWRSCAFRFGNPERLDPAAKPRSKVAWTWFWDNTERMIKRQTANIKGYQRAADRFIRHLTDDVVTQMRKDVYKVFFGVAPKGQDYFKQSSTRLNFIADKVLEMSLEMYKRPRGMVEEISALGLRHVGYGIPTELFAPFIEAWSQVLQMMLVEEKAASSLRWSLTLISKILVRTILEGSTIVMKAINTNSAKRFRKAIAISGRSQRAMEMLRITVGTQSISPLDWAIKSGSFQVARAMIDDLLTIRADRDNYYYGYDALFERHPDILNILSATRGQGLLPALLNGLLWRSKVTQNKTRRVNYYVKHLIQDQEGLFNAKQISVIIKTGDPKLMRHPVVSFVFNMLWSRLASIEFLKSRVLFMIQVVIFVLAQSILPRVAPKRESEPLRILLFSCRCSIYLFDMFLLLCAHIKYIVTDIRERSFIFVLGIPCPAYLKDLASALQLAMVIDLVHGIYEGAGLFSTHCPEAQGQTTVYSVFSQIGVLLHWLLLVDCCIFSLRLSSYFLTCFHVLAELLYFLSAILFLVLMFACSIAALDTLQGDFRSIAAGVRTLTKITLGMYPSEKIVELHDSPRILGLLIVFIVVVVVFLLNLLIAQLAGAYRKVYGDMEGFARLFRSGITVSTVRNLRPKRWAAFLKSLNFQERIEFNEGDIGIAGGIQVLESATLNPTNEERIRRFGGSTAPDMPWPEEESREKGNLDARLVRLEKLVLRATKKLTSSSSTSASGGSSFSGSSFQSSGS